LRSEQQSKSLLEASTIPSTEKKNKSRDHPSSVSPLFSPWKRFTHGSTGKDASRRDSVESIHSNQELFDRYANDPQFMAIAHEEETSRMSIDSNNNISHLP
jgi:hypothetical protein